MAQNILAGGNTINNNFNIINNIMQVNNGQASNVGGGTAQHRAVSCGVVN
jgi:hypothetical protein